METRELLIKAGLPKDLLNDLGQIKDYPDLQALWEVLLSKTTNRVIFVYGQPSPVKERTCAVLLKNLMELRKKKGLWLTPTKIPATQWGEGSYPFPAVGVTAVMGMDMLSPQQVKILVGHIRDQIPEDRMFILEVSHPAVLETILGKVALQYLQYYALALETTSTPTNPPLFHGTV